MFRPGNKLVVKRRKKIRKNARKNVLPLSDIEKYLRRSASYLGAIYVSSFKNLVVKAKCYSFLIYCKHHWIVLYCTKDSVEIFDSLGFLKTKSCITNNVLNFIKNQIGSKNFKSNHTIQSPTSQLCGIYSLYYILKRDNGHTFEQIMKTFTDNLLENDALMLRYFNKLSM